MGLVLVAVCGIVSASFGEEGLRGYRYEDGLYILVGLSVSRLFRSYQAAALTVIGASLVQVSVMGYQLLSGHLSIVSGTIPRPIGTFSNYVETGFCLSVGWCFTLGFLGGHQLRKWALAANVTLLFGVLLTASRGPWLAIVPISAFLIACRIRDLGGRSYWVAASAICFCGLSLLRRSSDPTSVESTYHSTLSRPRLWVSAIDYISKHSAGNVFTDTPVFTGSHGKTILDPKNLLLAFMVEFGILGLFLFAATLLLPLKKSSDEAWLEWLSSRGPILCCLLVGIVEAPILTFGKTNSLALLSFCIGSLVYLKDLDLAPDRPLEQGQNP